MNILLVRRFILLLLFGVIVTVIVIIILKTRSHSSEVFNPKDHRIYCAGPMDTPEELTMMHNIGVAVRNAGYKTYVPSDDGMALFQIFALVDSNLPTDEAKAEAKYWLMVAVFAEDAFNLLKYCDGTLANFNPPLNNNDDPDGGTVMEATTTFCFNYPLAIFKNSPNRLLPPNSNNMNGWDNPMLVALVNNFNIGSNDYAASTIPDAINRLNIAMKSNPKRTPISRMPSQLQKFIALGEIVHSVTEKYTGVRDSAGLWKMAQEVIAITKKNAPNYNVNDWNKYVPKTTFPTKTWAKFYI